MGLNLLEMKRYAIDKRIDIKFGDSQNECQINSKGLAKILSDDKTARVESILETAQSFEISGQGKSERLSRDQMAQIISEAFKDRGFATAAHDED